MKLKAICVGQRQHNSRPSDWHHCSTDLNVAEDVTKGISPEEQPYEQLNEDSLKTLVASTAHSSFLQLMSVFHQSFIEKNEV